MMRDTYLTFSNAPFGKFLTGAVGLPQPTPLARYEPGRPEIFGPVLVGAAPGSRLGDALARALAAGGATSLFHPGSADCLSHAAAANLLTGRYFGAESGEAGSLLFDASGIADPDGLEAAYEFFHDTIRAVARNGRVLVLGTTPEEMEAAHGRVAQRALEGLTRSLGKEAKRNITVNLVYAAPGAEDAIASTVQFFLSPRSAYVSGQVVKIAAPVGPVPEIANRERPQAGRTVLVTGAARGIGAAIAEVFARDGASVVCLDIPPAQAELLALAERLGGAALPLDITARDAGAALAKDASSRGGYDVVVHNAGITRDKTIAKMTRPLWDSVISVNLVAPLRITEALLAAGALRPNGRVVCVSSIAGIAGNLGQTNYAASKAGIIGLVQALAPELAAQGVTINAVAPGFIETAMTAAIPLTIREAGRRMNAMAQGGQPVDVAETIAWFAHPGSCGVSGNIIRVCGQSLLGA